MIVVALIIHEYFRMLHVIVMVRGPKIYQQFYIMSRVLRWFNKVEDEDNSAVLVITILYIFPNTIYSKFPRLYHSPTS